MSTMRKLGTFVIGVIFYSLSASSAHAVIMWEFINTPSNVGANEIVSMNARITNDSNGPDYDLKLLSQSIVHGSLISPPYSFVFGSFTEINGINLGTNASINFLFGTLTPNPGPIAAGTYTSGTATLGFEVADGQELFQATNNFQVTVRSNGSVPEPATLALMGLGLAGIGYRSHRRRKAA